MAVEFRLFYMARMMDSKPDELYSTPLRDVPNFQFDEAVVDVFPDMIKRSVPGYTTILHIIGQLVERYAQKDTACYDLGCSLGAGILAMRHRINVSSVKLIGVDTSEAMIERCQTVVDADSAETPVELICGDVTAIDLEPMSVCVLNFTLQFIPISQRKALLTRVANAMVPGGVLILSEKLAFNDPEHQDLMTELHHNFKRSNGYSDLEIAQKREAIDNVLIPETFDAHYDRLKEAGFRSADLWFQCFNFSSIVAFR